MTELITSKQKFDKIKLNANKYYPFPQRVFIGTEYYFQFSDKHDQKA